MTSEEAIEELKAIIEMDYYNVPLSKAALEKAIDTMRRYKKICKILDKSDNAEQCMYDTIEELEEVIDWNDI